MAISPLDVVKIRLQVQPEPFNLERMFSVHARNSIKYSGIVQAFKTIIAEEGVRVTLFIVKIIFLILTK
jgi:solute carrier family 25 thiamine pyrophosphate transporter 19